MSRSGSPETPLEAVDPIATRRGLVALVEPRVDAAARARLAERAARLGVSLDDDEITLYAALDTPARVQAFLNTDLYYNNDRAHPGQEETAMSPRRVLQTGRAHCFEGALLGYAINLLQGHAPSLVLLEAIQDVEHNLVVYRDPETGKWGANAHSSYPHLDGRAAEFTSLEALAASYLPWYYSGRTDDPRDLILVGYSEPIDLTARFGTEWITTRRPLWDIYYTYIDDSVQFHFLDQPGAPPHLYPVIRALACNWIRIGPEGPAVSVGDLPAEAQTVWSRFWQCFRPDDKRPRGVALDLEHQFRRLTGTTPIDLFDNANELRPFLAAGFRIEDVLRRPPPISK